MFGWCKDCNLSAGQQIIFYNITKTSQWQWVYLCFRVQMDSHWKIAWSSWYPCIIDHKIKLLKDALSIPLTHIYMTTHITGLVEALLIPLTHIYMTTHITDLVEALLIPLTHIYMTTHITGLVEALLIPLTHIYMTTHFTGLVEALLIPLTHIYMTTHFTGLVEVLLIPPGLYINIFFNLSLRTTN